MFVLPSRLRPGNVARLISAGHALNHFWLRVDDDDPTLDQYKALPLPPGWELRIGPRMGLAALYNEAFQACPDRPWYGVMADDVVPETPGWAEALIETAGNDGLAFGDDRINGSNHATHFVLGGGLVREMGWLALPGLSRLYIDTVWCDLAKTRGVFRYRQDVILRHHHFSNRLAVMDETYRKPDKAADKAIYLQAKERP